MRRNHALYSFDAPASLTLIPKVIVVLLFETASWCKFVFLKIHVINNNRNQMGHGKFQVQVSPLKIINLWKAYHIKKLKILTLFYSVGNWYLDCQHSELFLLGYLYQYYTLLVQVYALVLFKNEKKFLFWSRVLTNFYIMKSGHGHLPCYSFICIILVLVYQLSWILKENW